MCKMLRIIPAFPCKNLLATSVTCTPIGNAHKLRYLITLEMMMMIIIIIIIDVVMKCRKRGLL
jgi:hypothetical protein